MGTPNTLHPEYNVPSVNNISATDGSQYQQSQSTPQSQESKPKLTIFDYDGTNGKEVMESLQEYGTPEEIDTFLEIWKNDRERTFAYNREDTAYQRLANDLHAIGINPVALLQGASPISSSFESSSGGNRYTNSASLAETQRHNKQSEQQAILSAIVSMFGTILIATAMGLSHR